jgi:hypothetical protein
MLRQLKDARTELSWICRLEARQQFLSNIPEVLSNLVGQQSARRGAMKVFETLQDPRLNKQLFYVSSTAPIPPQRVSSCQCRKVSIRAEMCCLYSIWEFSVAFIEASWIHYTPSCPVSSMWVVVLLDITVEQVSPWLHVQEVLFSCCSWTQVRVTCTSFPTHCIPIFMQSKWSTVSLNKDRIYQENNVNFPHIVSSKWFLSRDLPIATVYLCMLHTNPT